MIAKGAKDAQLHRWHVTRTASAREAIAKFVSSLDLDRPARVVVPAYYGWSPNEGSGVMDPLVAVGAEVALVRVGRDLQLELDHYRATLEQFKPDVVMPISYFGWPDRHFADVVRWARIAGAVVMEDGAHSLLTTLLHGQVEVCDAAALSLHKSLPTVGGGLLIERRTDAPLADDATGVEGPWMFDLGAIGRARQGNARIIASLLRNEPDVKLLRPDMPDSVVPLNVPVLVPPDRRQSVYVELNNAGFGVVCLYHKLGPGITVEQHPDSFWLSARLVNLPCHQDVDPDEIPAMVRALLGVVRAEG